MRYAKMVVLKGGVELLVRNAVASDARALRETTQRTHAQTDYLLSCPDEQSVDDEQEARSLEETECSSNEVELVAIIDGRIVGSAGVSAVRSRRKVAHRARFGISILKGYWGMGIGRVLMDASMSVLGRRVTPNSSSKWWRITNGRCLFTVAQDSRNTGATPGATGPRLRDIRSSCT